LEGKVVGFTNFGKIYWTLKRYIGMYILMEIGVLENLSLNKKIVITRISVP
jgi:hypothetical protein